jgi:hypothetical protein
MAQEWGLWALEQRQYWKFLPATVLAVFATYEARKVWVRTERILGLP